MPKHLVRLAVAIGVAVGLLGAVSAEAPPHTCFTARGYYAPDDPAWGNADTNSVFGVCGKAGTEHGP